MKAIIFDLDGTLWEVTNETYKSVNEITKKYNLGKIDIKTICSVFGLNRKETAKLYFPNLTIDEALKITNEISILNIQNLQKRGGNLYPDLKETLFNLKQDYQLFIVSNSGHSEYIEAFLNTSKLKDYFTDYIAASKLDISKAEAIKKVINDYNIKKAIYVGDTKKDFEASKIANIPFVHAKYGFGKDFDSKYSIMSIKELPSVIKEIF